jgi:hypothetical protein
MNGKYAINDQLVNQISLNYRRKGKISYCINVSEMHKVKLKMHGNKIVDSLYDMPNSIVVNGFMDPKVADQIR